MPEAQITPNQPMDRTAACPLCGCETLPAFDAAEWQLRPQGRVFGYRACHTCKSMFASPQPTTDEVEWLYANRYDYQWFARRRGLKRVQAWHRWKRLSPLLRKFGSVGQAPRLLDVGGGHAWFLRAAKAAGWQAEGLELLNDELLATARAEGLEMHHGLLLDHPLAGEKFHCLTMWHVLEHIPDPVKALKAAADLLEPGGLLVLAVPNLQSLGYRDAGSAWVWCQKPFIHPWHFSSETLRQILPPELEMVLTTSRDTWDGQWVETTAFYRTTMRLIYLASRVPHKLSRMLGFKAGSRASDELQFWAEELLRLSTYAAYLTIRPLIKGSYEDSLRASELFVIARRR